MCTTSHRAGRGELGQSDAYTNVPSLWFRSVVTQTKYSMQWLVKGGKKEQGLQVAFTKNVQKNLKGLVAFMVRACILV